jgi:ribonuclease HII
VAKVTRDRLMRALAARHDGYAWERNAGYGTAAHLAALRLRGRTAHHRRSFLGRLDG